MKPEKQTLHYSGRVVSLTTDEVVLPNGHRALLEVVHHPGGAAVAAIDAEERVCLLRQYRYVADGWIWELPAGKLEPQEPPLATAQRELIEEAGISAQTWRDLGVCLPSPGVFSERIYLYMATALAAAAEAHEHAEVIQVHWVPLQQACLWALDGTINDMKTAVGLLRARNMYRQHGVTEARQFRDAPRRIVKPCTVRCDVGEWRRCTDRQYIIRELHVQKEAGAGPSRPQERRRIGLIMHDDRGNASVDWHDAPADESAAGAADPGRPLGLAVKSEEPSYDPYARARGPREAPKPGRARPHQPAQAVGALSN